MEDLYGTAPISGTGLASDSEEISNILNQLLHNSSSPFSSASSSSCVNFENKHANLVHSSIPVPPQKIGSFPETAERSVPLGPKALPEDRFRLGRSANRSEPDFSLVDGGSGAGSSAAADSSSGFNFSDPGGYFGAEVKEGAENTFCSAGILDSDANTSLNGRRISPENDLGDFSCDSEGPEGSEVPFNPARSRSSSKRSRAAEVHNLSEKRRRSRINEKMKALQNLIPNSNKTDKASMLDEAIEYLKQLQLQVQMLSMRNGISLHPMCFPGMMHPMQLPLPQTGMGYNEENKFLSSSRGISTFFGREESLMPSAYNVPSACTISNQLFPMQSIANLPPPEASLGFEQSIHAHYRPFNLPTSSQAFCADGKPQLQPNSCFAEKGSSEVDIISSKNPNVKD
ncbi:hypothetical protein UlMin_035037 [Ulmus minor]